MTEQHISHEPIKIYGQPAVDTTDWNAYADAAEARRKARALAEEEGFQVIGNDASVLNRMSKHDTYGLAVIDPRAAEEAQFAQRAASAERQRKEREFVDSFSQYAENHTPTPITVEVETSEPVEIPVVVEQPVNTEYVPRHRADKVTIRAKLFGKKAINKVS